MTLKLENISKVVGRETHIYDLSLELEPGSLNVLLGLTQAGKTTLMRLMAGLDRPTTGRVLFDGADIAPVPLRKRNTAMVYQQFINYPSMTVYENIASPLRLMKLSRAEIDRRVRAEAERMHIEHMLDRLPSELSGGQQQRTAMARSLVRDARLLLLDEPLVNLDYKLREELRLEMREIFSDRNAIVVYATTDPWEALALGGKTIVLQAGRLVQYGPTLSVHEHPANEHVAMVFSDPPMNLMDGEIEGEEVKISGNIRFPRPPQFADLKPGRYRIGIRPQHIYFGTNRAETTVNVTGKVVIAEISGSDTLVHMAHGDLPWILVQDGVHHFDLGQQVESHFEPERLYAFSADGNLLVAGSRPGGLPEIEPLEEAKHGAH